MRAVSLCSGIGAPETAMPHWNWLWCAEVEPAASAVLQHHRPTTRNLGDITAKDFVARALDWGIPDVIVAGTPCQAFSYSGLRVGLGDPRGNLTLVALRIWKEICDVAKGQGIAEPLFVWENVPGALSAPGNPFGHVLAALAGCDAVLPMPMGLTLSLIHI